jgi:glycosyltransferase involved in cell wall biosynthesis
MTHAVLHVLGSARVEGASIARIVALLGEQLKGEKYRLHAWFLADDGPLREELEASGIATRFIRWPGGAGDLRGLASFCLALRASEFAIVHQHYGGRIIRMVTRAVSRARIIFHAHGRVDEQAPRMRLPINTGTCDRVVACSRAVAGQVVGREARVIYAGVKAVPARTRANRGKPVVIGAASRMVPSKGLGVMIDAVDLLHRRHPEVRVELAGDGREREILEGKVRELGMRNVTFLGWRKLDEVIPSWDIFVQPSLQEPFGLANLEAMREALPVVASRTGGIPEVIVDGSTGILVDPGDARSLAEALGRLVADEGLRREMGAAGRRLALDVFSPEALGRSVESLYDEVLSER